MRKRWEEVWVRWEKNEKVGRAWGQQVGMGGESIKIKD